MTIVTGESTQRISDFLKPGAPRHILSAIIGTTFHIVLQFFIDIKDCLVLFFLNEKTVSPEKFFIPAVAVFEETAGVPEPLWR